MTSTLIRNGFSPTLPPRRCCAAALRPARPPGGKTLCSACTVECDPDGELRVTMVFQQGRTRSLAPSTAPISSWISRWIRRRA